jgi:hypothetical protein
MPPENRWNFGESSLAQHGDTRQGNSYSIINRAGTVTLHVSRYGDSRMPCRHRNARIAPRRARDLLDPGGEAIVDLCMAEVGMR